MRPVRSMMGGSRFFQTRTVAAKLAIALVVGSLIDALLGGAADWIRLVPGLVIDQFAVWQPLTYAFIEISPLGVIFGALITWSIGSALESTWGPRRLLTFAVGTTVISGIATVLLSLVVPSIRNLPYPGGTVMGTALWVAYGLSIGRGQANFWGMPVTGNVLALIGVGFVVLTGLRAPVAVVPDAFAIVLAFIYSRGFSPRVVWLRLHAWYLQRKLKARSRHLRVVDRDRNMPRDSDRYLH